MYSSCCRYSLFRTLALVVLTLLTTTHSASSAQPQGALANVSFHGILKHFPCHINDDQLVEVHFGKIGINKINGENYLQKIDYTITCDGDDPVDDMMLSVNGAVSVFDTAALQTNIQDLAIRLYENGKPLEINKPITIDPAHRPELTAVPIKRTDTDITTGDFKVIATLLVNYQ